MLNEKLQKELDRILGNEKDCGRYGKAFELTERNLLQKKCKNFKIARPNQFDVTFYELDGDKWKMIKVETKTGCGEIAKIDENGVIDWGKWFKNDYICYSPKADTNQCYWLTPDDFIQALIECKLLYKKLNTPMSKRRKEGLDWYENRLAIQEFRQKHSKGREMRWISILEKYDRAVY